MLVSVDTDRFGSILATPVSEKQRAKLKKAMRAAGLSTRGAPIFAQDGGPATTFLESYVPASKQADVGQYRVHIRMSDEVVYELAGVPV